MTNFPLFCNTVSPKTIKKIRTMGATTPRNRSGLQVGRLELEAQRGVHNKEKIKIVSEYRITSNPIVQITNFDDELMFSACWRIGLRIQCLRCNTGGWLQRLF